MTSFWLGAVHAPTAGHGKTIAACYIVDVRGRRPVDALVLGIFVTLLHTSGIVLVAPLATIGSAWFIPQRVEAYLAIGTGILVIGICCWMLRTQARLSFSRAQTDTPSAHVHAADARDHHHGDVELVRIPPAPSVDAVPDQGSRAPLWLADRDDGQDAS